MAKKCKYQLCLELFMWSLPVLYALCQLVQAFTLTVFS